MKNGLYVVLGLLLLGSLVSCQDSTKGINEPDWAINLPSESGYISFVGYVEELGLPSEARDSALNAAKAKLMSYIFEESSVQQTFTASGLLDDDTLKREYQQTIESKSMANLTGLSPEEFEYQEIEDGGLSVVHAWVLLKVPESDVEAERTRIIEEIERQLELVDAEVREAEAAIEDGRIMDGIEAYITAALNSVDVEDRASEFQIYINKALKHLNNFQLEADDDNPGQADTAITTDFKFYVYYVGDDGKVPVSGSRVNFSLEDNRGDYTESAISEDDGSVECSITALDTVNNNTKLNVKLSMDVQDLVALGSDYYVLASSLVDTIEKTSSYDSFSVVSLANLGINTSVIGIVYSDGDFEKESSLTSDAYSYLLDLGYTSTRFPEYVDLEAVYDLKQTALNQLSTEGIERVFILAVENIVPTYNSTLERYIANYSLSAQLVDTKTGQVIESDTVRVNATGISQDEVFGAFIQAASSKIERLLD